MVLVKSHFAFQGWISRCQVPPAVRRAASASDRRRHISDVDAFSVVGAATAGSVRATQQGLPADGADYTATADTELCIA